MDCQVSRLVSIWLGVGGAGPVSDWLRLARAGSVTPGLTGCRRRPRPEGATADRPTGAVQDTGHGSVEARGGRGPAPPRAAHSVGAGTAGRGVGVLPAQLL